MTKQLQDILEELYKLDPSFKAHEEKLAGILNELIASKPTITINEQFAQDLRHKLTVHGQMLSELEPKHKTMRFAKFYYLAGGLAVIAVAVLGTQAYNGKLSIQNKESVTTDVGALLGKETKIAQLKPQAFGNLNAVNFVSGKGGGGGNGGVTQDTMMNPASSKIAVGQGGGADIYAPVNYVFKYTGEKFTIPETEMNVYKRIKNDAGDAGSALLSGLNFGLLNLNKFTNKKMDTVTFVEDKPYGYTVMVNFRESSVNINENWQTWPMPTQNCKDEQCFLNAQLKPDQVPDNEQVINIANNFLSTYGISTSDYGQPVVQDAWRAQLLSARVPSQLYIPDIMSVIYPLILDGKTVYDEGGTPSGLVTNVNIRFNKASGLYDLTNRSYETSAYATETDTARLLKLAETGNFRGYPAYSDPNTKTQTLELGTPTISFSRVWKYDNNSSEELYVPALIFPITKNSTTQPYYQTNIVIPLIKEVLDQAPQPPISIMDAAR